MSAGAVGKPASQDQGLQWGNTAMAKPAHQVGLWGNKHPHFSLLFCNLLSCLHWLNPKGSQKTELSDAVQGGQPLDTEEGRKGCGVDGEGKYTPP